MAGLALCCVGPLAADPLQAREQLREWVDVQKTISAERAAWTAEEAILRDMIALLTTEIDSLEERIEAARAATDTTSAKRTELETARAELMAAMDALEPQVVVFENRIRALYHRLPGPLQQEVTPLYNRLPEDPARSRLGVVERLQAVVGILSQADKFNGGVTLVSELRQVGDRNAEVKTLYFGLAGAFFSDAAGSYTGLGRPGANGWVFEEAPEFAPEIVNLIAVYEGTAEAAFVTLPVTLSGE